MKLETLEKKAVREFKLETLKEAIIREFKKETSKKLEAGEVVKYSSWSMTQKIERIIEKILRQHTKKLYVSSRGQDIKIKLWKLDYDSYMKIIIKIKKTRTGSQYSWGRGEGTQYYDLKDIEIETLDGIDTIEEYIRRAEELLQENKNNINKSKESFLNKLESHGIDYKTFSQLYDSYRYLDSAVKNKLYEENK